MRVQECTASEATERKQSKEDKELKEETSVV